MKACSSSQVNTKGGRRARLLIGWLAGWLHARGPDWGRGTSLLRRPAVKSETSGPQPAPPHARDCPKTSAASPPSGRKRLAPLGLLPSSARLSLSLAGGGVFNDVISALWSFPRYPEKGPYGVVLGESSARSLVPPGPPERPSCSDEGRARGLGMRASR